MGDSRQNMQDAGRPSGPPRDTDEAWILWNVGLMSRHFHTICGGRTGQMKVAAFLDAHGGHMSQKDMQRRLEISSASLSELLAKLETEELVTRARSDEDRRQIDIRLTNKGRELSQEFSREAEAFELKSFAFLTPEERHELRTTLDKIVAHWKEM